MNLFFYYTLHPFVIFKNNLTNLYNLSKKLIIDLINKLIPTERQTSVKVFLIRVLPFNLDKWAPK